MTLDELIEALQELKNSGRCLDKAIVYYGEDRIRSVSIIGDCDYIIAIG